MASDSPGPPEGVPPISNLRAEPQLQEAKERIMRAILARSATDRPMAGTLALLPLAILGMVGLLFLFLLFLGGQSEAVLGEAAGGWILGALEALLGGLLFLAFIIVVVNFRLLRRMNEHSAREAYLRQGILDYFDRRARALGLQGEVVIPMTTLARIHADGLSDEVWRSPLPWSFLAITPLLGPLLQLVTFHFLTGHTYAHHYRWQFFIQNAQWVGQRLGIPIVLPLYPWLKRRSFGLYLLLYFLTLGFFGMYWYYVLLQDPNDHILFEHHFEDLFLAALER